MCILADATRAHAFWRPLFGHASSPGSEQDPVSNLTKPPDCILEVARRVIANESIAQGDELLRPTLRLIANCCADDNVSRRVLVQRDGISHLKRLVLKRRALDVLLPTLYNVCVDYDEIAVDANGKQQSLDNLDASTQLTKAEQALGQYIEHDGEALMAVGLFLNPRMQRDQQLFGLLADLAEMASRPALFGMHQIAGEDEGKWPSRADELLQSLVECGIPLAEEDNDSQQAILQIFLNVLTQKQVQLRFLQGSERLKHLINLFTIGAPGDPDLKSYRDSLLQMVYTLSALPEYASAVSPESTVFQALVRRLETLGSASGTASPPQIASIIVLLANAITSADHVTLIHEHHTAQQLSSAVVCVLCDSSSHIVTVPALDLIGRLALDRRTQHHLLSNPDLLENLTQRLQQPSSTSISTSISSLPTQAQSQSQSQSHTLTIHRESIALTRLLFRSLQTPLSSLPSFALLHANILALFDRTLDTNTKLEIGRYSIEILRNISLVAARPETTTTPTNADADQTTIFASTVTNGTPPSIPPLLLPLLFLTTDSPTAGSRSQGVFGLGLLLSTTPPHAFPELLPAFIAQKRVLLDVLGAVVREDREGLQGPPAADAGEVDGEPTATHKADAENVKIVVVQLLRGLRYGSESAGAVTEVEGREELLRGLEELSQEMGLQV
ncbi:uncharacterized protein HMPREF1541_10102 [Cyphellophora europaea CBS 101466]|uniref:UNC-45/Cro1/She4 central domain-containing protein n=1 Tax=Cyphellophora europaea (strain CBS 101466) TaxID=1220924 RepID=W2S9A1_CYPE1|nr:uncharacterized protein HMPREF1541_10102 [Cyphellophora europaea CBS 101466]ETN45225.1 hypothetical protein HMPREF1541_10102 [Cyphellophora europaea CBS 101466]